MRPANSSTGSEIGSFSARSVADDIVCPRSNMVALGGTLSEREQRFDRWRRRLGRLLGPMVFLLVWFLPLSSLDVPAHRLLAVFGLVVTFWVTEAIPLPVTALLGPALCVVCGVATGKEVFKNFGHPIIFLFLGSFLLAQGMFRHGLNRRIAFGIIGLKGVGQNPALLLGAFGGITAFLSMWISNTTSAAMMFPIGTAILSEMARQQAQQTGREIHFTQLKYGTGLMLTTAFAASIGGLATPVGTPPNLIGISQLEKAGIINITFFQWMALGLPLAVALTIFLVLYLGRACPAEASFSGANPAWIQQEKAKLGSMSRGELNVCIAFGITVALWLLPGIASLVLGSESPAYQWLRGHVPESVAALIGATLLFLLPVKASDGEFTLRWADAGQIDWGTILLFGGGLALGEVMFSTGLAKWAGEGLVDVFQVHSSLGLTVLFAVVGVLLTETTSNTASATMIVPVAIAVAQAAKINPVPPALAACLGASLAFMLPVSTPPNAIVFGSGCVPLTKMVRHGVVVDIVGVVLIVAIVQWWVPVVFM